MTSPAPALYNWLNINSLPLVNSATPPYLSFIFIIYYFFKIFEFIFRNYNLVAKKHALINPARFVYIKLSENSSINPDALSRFPLLDNNTLEK